MAGDVFWLSNDDLLVVQDALLRDASSLPPDGVTDFDELSEQDQKELGKIEHVIKKVSAEIQARSDRH